VLEKVCEYFYYNEKHKNSKDVPDIDVPAELCLELLMAADYLNGEFLHSFHSYAMSSCDTVCLETRLLFAIFSVRRRANQSLQFEQARTRSPEE
jgi:hypothetical protein